MKKRLWIDFVLMLMVLGSFFFAFKPAAAQTGTTVDLTPNPAIIYLNGTNSQVVEVWVKDAVNLNFFEVILTYDANLASVDSWAFGNFFEMQLGGCVRNTNTPGYLWLACTQLAKPGKSGSGVMFTMTISGETIGVTPLTFEKVELVNKFGYLISPPFTNGRVFVIDSSAIVLTTLSGSIDLQGRTNRGGVPVALSYGQNLGQGPYTVPTTNVSGNNLAFTNVAMDVYTVSTGQAGYLNISPEMGRQIALLASGNVLPPLRLIGGNAVWTGHATSNDQIDIFDVALVSGEIGKITFNPDADINGNGKVDIFDLAMVAGNYGMNSVDAYAGWMQ